MSKKKKGLTEIFTVRLLTRFLDSLWAIKKPTDEAQEIATAVFFCKIKNSDQLINR